MILLDPHGCPAGTAPKRTVHGSDTPLHLGFSCYLTDGAGRVLLTRRAASKATWPSTWTNACCGHPQPGETLRAAVARRLRDELGVTAGQFGLAVPDFTYRSVMDNGIVEHEVCPVVVGRLDGQLALNPAEVDDAQWVEWDALRARARNEAQSLSPWSVSQIAELASLETSPSDWRTRFDGAGLDTPIDAMPASVDGCAGDPLWPVQDATELILADYLTEQMDELVAVDPSLGDIAAEIAGLITAGGKRLRPAFVYWGHRASGGTEDTGVLHVAAAVEMLHTFALLHDDVMDRAHHRRGRPTAQRAFAGMHHHRRLAGDAEWYGTSAAILAGDLAFVWADDLVDRAPLPTDVLARVRRAFTTLRVEVMAGQYLDLRLDRLDAADHSAARRVALLKSGRYTVTRPLAIGHALAGVDDPATARALAIYGDAVGMAFQIRDDVLGLFGDPDVTGKSSTSDLREGKRTVLMLRALDLASPLGRTTLERALGNPCLGAADVERCREIVAGCGALASVETLVRSQYDIAVEATARLPEPSGAALRALARSAVHRRQ